MGKGYNNYMTKKFFHPSSKENIKRVWMAQQKDAHDKQKQEELLNQYQREQEMYSNRALLGDEKAQLGLSFMYDAPPGLKKKEKEDDDPEFKFEWQRRFNAPRECYAKDDETIRDQPFGIEVRNVRCIKCRQWGHVNTDKICPLYGRDLTAEPPRPGESNDQLAEGMKEEGLMLKQSILGKRLNPRAANEQLVGSEDEDDPEVKFLKGLTPKQKKKLLKKLDQMQKAGTDEKKRKKKHRKKIKEESSDSDDQRKKSKKGGKGKKSKRKVESTSSESDGDSESEEDDEHRRRKLSSAKQGRSTSELHDRRRQHPDHHGSTDRRPRSPGRNENWGQMHKKSRNGGKSDQTWSKSPDRRKEVARYSDSDSDRGERKQMQRDKECQEIRQRRRRSPSSSSSESDGGGHTRKEKARYDKDRLTDKRTENDRSHRGRNISDDEYEHKQKKREAQDRNKHERQRKHSTSSSDSEESGGRQARKYSGRHGDGSDHDRERAYRNNGRRRSPDRNRSQDRRH